MNHADHLIVIALCGSRVPSLDSDMLLTTMVAFTAHLLELVACACYAPWLFEQSPSCFLDDASQVEPAAVEVVALAPEVQI